MALPFHGPRSPSTARYSGELFASVGRRPDERGRAPGGADVNVVKRWLTARRRLPRSGLLGASASAARDASLMAGLCDDLAFAIPLVPPVTLEALASSLLRARGAGALGLPVALADVRAAYAVHCPLDPSFAVPAERVLIVGARGDRIVPPEHAYALWRHWDEPGDSLVQPGSHIAPFRRARLIARVRAHLDTLTLQRMTPSAATLLGVVRFVVQLLSRAAVRPAGARSRALAVRGARAVRCARDHRCRAALAADAAARSRSALPSDGRSSGCGCRAVPRHHRGVGSSLKIAKCRCGRVGRGVAGAADVAEDVAALHRLRLVQAGRVPVEVGVVVGEAPVADRRGRR